MAKKTLTIRTMFPRLDREEFIDHHWAKELVVAHGQLSRLGALAEYPDLGDAESLLRLPPSSITAQWRDSSTKAGSVAVEPKQAAAIYKQGRYTLAMEMSGHPAIKPSLKTLLKELGTPVLEHGCTAFAMPEGATTAMRWLDHDVFIVQVSGSSTWRVAKNQAVLAPTAPYEAGGPVPPEVAALTGKGPIARPGRTERIALAPGSVLHLPRGMWQSAACDKEGVVLMFAFKAATWADWFPDHLRLGLVGDVRFRRPAVGLTARDRAARASAEAEIARLLPVMSERAREWGRDVFLGTRKIGAPGRRRAAARAK